MNNTEANIRIVKNSLFLYLRLIVTLVVGLLASRAILDALGIEDYGLYNLVGGFVMLLGIISASLTGASTRFITYSLGEDNPEKLSRTFTTINSLMIVLAAFVFLFGLFVGYFFIFQFLNIPIEKHSSAFFVFVCSLFVFSMSIVSIPYTAIVTAHERMNFYAGITIFESMMKLMIAYSLYKFASNRLFFYAALLALLSLLICLVYGFYSRHNFKEVTFNFGFDKAVTSQVFGFSFWLSLSCGAGLLKDYGGNILLNIFYGLVYNASNGVAVQVKNVVSSFANNIGAAITPQITKSYASGDVSRAISLTLSMAKFQGFSMLIVLVPIIIQCPYLLSIWLKEVPISAVSFVRLMSCICFVTTMTLAYGPLFMAIGDIKSLQVKVSILGLFNLPICYVLYKLEGCPEIYLYVTLAIELCMFFLCFWNLKKKVNFPFREIIGIFLFNSFLMCLLLGGGYLLDLLVPVSSFGVFLFSSLLGELIIITSIWFLGMNRREREYVLSFIRAKSSYLISLVSR